MESIHPALGDMIVRNLILRFIHISAIVSILHGISARADMSMTNPQNAASEGTKGDPTDDVNSCTFALASAQTKCDLNQASSSHATVSNEVSYSCSYSQSTCEAVCGDALSSWQNECGPDCTVAIRGAVGQLRDAKSACDRLAGNVQYLSEAARTNPNADAIPSSPGFQGPARFRNAAVDCTDPSFASSYECSGMGQQKDLEREIKKIAAKTAPPAAPVVHTAAASVGIAPVDSLPQTGGPSASSGFGPSGGTANLASIRTAKAQPADRHKTQTAEEADFMGLNLSDLSAPDVLFPIGLVVSLLFFWNMRESGKKTRKPKKSRERRTSDRRSEELEDRRSQVVAMESQQERRKSTEERRSHEDQRTSQRRSADLDSLSPKQREIEEELAVELERLRASERDRKKLDPYANPGTVMLAYGNSRRRRE